SAERTLLGCALVEAECLYRVLPLLKVDDFSLDSNRRIFHSLSRLAEQGKPGDVMTVTDELASRGHLQAIGGVGYLASLTDTLTAGFARTMNVEHYALQVVDKSRRRKAHAAAEHLIAVTEDASVETADCLHQIEESLLQIEADSAKTTARS